MFVKSFKFSVNFVTLKQAKKSTKKYAHGKSIENCMCLMRNQSLKPMWFHLLCQSVDDARIHWWCWPYWFDDIGRCEDIAVRRQLFCIFDVISLTFCPFFFISLLLWRLFIPMKEDDLLLLFSFCISDDNVKFPWCPYMKKALAESSPMEFLGTSKRHLKFGI